MNGHLFLEGRSDTPPPTPLSIQPLFIPGASWRLQENCRASLPPHLTVFKSFRAGIEENLSDRRIKKLSEGRFGRNITKYIKVFSNTENSISIC